MQFIGSIGLVLLIVGITCGHPVQKQESLSFDFKSSKPSPTTVYFNLESETEAETTIEPTDINSQVKQEILLENKPYYDVTEVEDRSGSPTEKSVEDTQEKEREYDIPAATTISSVLEEDSFPTTEANVPDYPVKNSLYVPTMEQYLKMNPHLTADNVAVQVSVLGDLGMNLPYNSKKPFPSHDINKGIPYIKESPHNKLSKLRVVVKSTTASPVIIDQLNILKEIPQNLPVLQNTADKLEDYDGLVLSSQTQVKN